VSNSGGPDRSGSAGLTPAAPRALLFGLLALLSTCSSALPQLVETPVLDDGACARPLGIAHTFWDGPVIGATSDGAQTFFVDARDGHLRARNGDLPTVVLTPRLVAAPDRVGWGWLLADRAHVYWIPGHIEGPSSSELQLVRVPKQGGPVQRGFQPPGPVIAAHIDEWGGLLLTEEGLWRLDLRDWGKARLIRAGQYATLAADPRRAYLRSINEPGPMDFVAHQVLDSSDCHEPDSASIVSVDRQSGSISTLWSSKELSLFGPLVADETHLYTAATATEDTGDEKSCRVRRLVRIGKESGSVVVRRVPAGIGGDLIGYAGQLYWTDTATGRVFRTPKGGGDVVVAAQLSCRPNRLLGVGDEIAAWRSDGGRCGLTTVPRAGTLATAVAALEAGDALLTVAAGWVYVSNSEDAVRRISLAKGTTEPVRARKGAPLTAIQAVPFDEAIFFVEPDHLTRWSPTGELTRVFDGHLRALAVDGDQLFAATEDGSIAVMGKAGLPRTLVPGAGGAVRDLAALRRAAYWIEGASGSRGAGRALWTAGPDGVRNQVLAIDGMTQIAADGRSVYYATEGRSRTLPGEREVSGTIMRLSDGVPGQVVDKQETITDLRAGRHGLFWRQRRGIRWVDESGAMRAVDCTVGDQGVGLVESDGVLYWADASARAVLGVKLPSAGR
jgi:hypothetical protein